MPLYRARSALSEGLFSWNSTEELDLASYLASENMGRKGWDLESSAQRVDLVQCKNAHGNLARAWSKWLGMNAYSSLGHLGWRFSVLSPACADDHRSSHHTKV